MNYFSGLVEIASGQTSLNSADHLNMMVRQPFGVVAAIVPWNFPTMLVGGWNGTLPIDVADKIQACHEIGPSCGAGNALILKVKQE